MGNNCFLVLKNISKTYKGKKKKILDNFNLSVKEGSFLTIIGPSGSGKTSLLNLIGGFITPDEGKILLNGIDIKDIPANQRPTATVFQDYALFSHMNVFENIAYGLKKMYTDKDYINPNVYKVILQQQHKANQLSNFYIKKIKKRILKYSFILKNYDKKYDSLWFKKLYSLHIKWLKYKILDLDYWISHWQYYPILTAQSLKQKYLQRSLNNEEIKERVFKLINLFGLQDYEYDQINTLSGGTKQRVALARSLITQPKILLLDEPLAAIDKQLREKLQLELKRLHNLFKITFILITHDQKEALMLSDQVIVLNKGKIEQIGTSNEIYDSPINPWVAKFMGKANLFYGIYDSPGKVLVKDTYFFTDLCEGFEKNEKVVVMIRPEDYDVVEPNNGIISAIVKESLYKGQLWELKCNFHNNIIYVENIDEVIAGQNIGLTWDPIDVHVMKYAKI